VKTDARVAAPRLGHAEHARQQRLSTPCAAHHQTFGGLCLNCGHRDVYFTLAEPEGTRRLQDD
jgi:hypothetical protein